MNVNVTQILCENSSVCLKVKMCEYKAPQFFIKEGSVAFCNRQKGVFDQLIAAERETTERQRGNKCVLIESDNVDISKEIVTYRPPRRQCKKFRGKESIFKVPDVTSLKLTSIPDFKRHPHRWIKYSLGDVTADDMSEQSNRAAALSFLRELDERKRKDTEDELENSSIMPIIYRNPKNRISIQDKKEGKNFVEDETKPHFVSTKLVMPEYVIGEKRAKKRIQSTDKILEDKSSKFLSGYIKLGHLNVENEDE